MPIQNCRQTINNPTARQDIVNTYNLLPIAHIAQLPGQTKPNCCGGIITTNYYAFEYVHRQNQNDKGTFFVGDSCANDFLMILNINRLPLFNPLAGAAGGGGGNNGGGNAAPRPQINIDLYNAINLFLAHFNITPHENLGSVLNFVRTSNFATQDWSIKLFNRILGSYNTTMTNILNELNANHNNMRVFTFTELNNRVQMLLNNGQVNANNIL